VIARVAGLALLVPLAFTLNSDAIPLTLRLLLAVFWIVAAARPHAALVALTVLVPLGYAEALVLATLSGTLVAFARPPTTMLRPQRPSLVPPAIVFCALVSASAVMMRSVTDAARLVAGIVLMIVVARHARDAVTRPAQLVAATALAGALAAFVVLETQVHISLHASSFFVMTAFVALALAMNRRHTRVPRYPRVTRALWIGAAALMTVAMWAGAARMAPPAAAHRFLQIAGPLRVAALAAFVWMLGAMAMRLARGLRADPGDRLLVGSAAALAVFLVIWTTSYPRIAPEIAFPFWILAGAALARADGNAQPPFAASRGSIE
jgi:hypothetical protein